MSLPAPFGMRFVELENALRGIGESNGTGFSILYARFLCELGLAEELPHGREGTGDSLVSAEPRVASVLDLLVLGLEIWNEASTQAAERYRRFRLTDDGIAAFYSAFVYKHDGYFQAHMRQQLSQHPTVLRILSPFRGWTAIELDGARTHLVREFGQAVSMYDLENLLAFFERYGLLDVVRDPFGIRIETFHVLEHVPAITSLE